MATLDELVVRIKADASQLEREMRKAGAVSEQTGRRVGKSMDSAGASIGSLKSQVAALAGVLAGHQIVSSITSFEKIEASLRTVTGSAENAATAFDMVRRFAATTPFAVEEAAQAFIKLKALGLTPSEEALISYGNTASAMGKSLNQMIEAVADAATGEFERLKEFGIRARDAGDSVKFTFQGITTTVKKNATDIETYLRSIGDINFAGAMAEQEGTLSVALSNMGDSFSNLAKAIGDAGVTDLLKGISHEIGNLARTASENIPKAKLGIKAIVAGVAMQFVDDPDVKNAMVDNLIDDAERLMPKAPVSSATPPTGGSGEGWGGGKGGKRGKSEKKKEAEDYDRAGDALSDLLAKYELEAELAQLSGRALEERRAEIEATTAAIKGGMLGESQKMIEQIRESAGASYEAAEAQKALAERMAESKRFAQELKDKLSDSLSDAVLDFDNATEAAERFARALANTILERKITGPLADSLLAQVDSSSMFSGIGDFIGSWFGGARASGGPVAAGKSYLVGEKGPEIFSPTSGGQIIPNNQIGTGGVTIVQHNNFSSGVQRADLAAMMPAIIAQTKGAVVEEIQRGGSMSRAIGMKA